jgi:HTH-type transcriptional regulator/antitoxin HipB
MPTSSSEGIRVRSPESLGRAVRATRIAEELTQAELAERARANRYAIALLESGHETRAIQILFDALAALNLELVVRPRKS